MGLSFISLVSHFPIRTSSSEYMATPRLAAIQILSLQLHPIISYARGSSAGRQNFPDDARRRLDNQLVLLRVDALLELVEALALAHLDFARRDGLAAVDLPDDVVDHDARPAAGQRAGAKIGVRPLDGVGAIVLAYPPSIITSL